MTPRQYGDKYRDHLLEQYKQSVEMADRLGQRKEQTSRLYVTLMTALIAASSFAIASWPEKYVEKFSPELPGIVGIIGIVLGLAWFTTLQALERQIQAKTETIREIELGLPFPLHSVEIIKRNRIGPIHNFKLPIPDLLLPFIFTMVFLISLAWAIDTVL